MTLHEPTRKILRVINSFPCLAERLKGWQPERFNPNTIISLLPEFSSGERVCALFILTIWDPAAAKGKPWEFNLMDFMKKADLEHRRALQDWMENPEWP